MAFSIFDERIPTTSRIKVEVRLIGYGNMNQQCEELVDEENVKMLKEV